MTREEAQRHFDQLSAAAVLPEGFEWLWAESLASDVGVENDLCLGHGEGLLRVAVGFLWSELDEMTPENMADMFSLRMANSIKAVNARRD